jgi:hypothetical protein
MSFTVIYLLLRVFCSTCTQSFPEQPDIPVDTFFESYKELNQKSNQKDTPNLPEPEVQETKQINGKMYRLILNSIKCSFILSCYCYVWQVCEKDITIYGKR